MADTAAHLVERVFPIVPVRQWVLSLPFALRYRMAYDARLTSDVLTFSFAPCLANCGGELTNCGVSALRSAERYLRQSASEIRFTYESHGKPQVCLRAGDPPIRFNVSHSEGLAVYAIAINREIGVDVEAIRVNVPIEDIARQFFSPREISEFCSITEDKQAEAFFLWWSRKEAYLKALGSGLSLPLNTFGVSLHPETPACLRSKDSERWTITGFRPKEGYAGAVVVEGEGFTLQHWNYGSSRNVGN